MKWIQRPLSLLLSAALIFTLLAACGGDSAETSAAPSGSAPAATETEKDTFTVVLDSDIVALDPAFAYDFTTNPVVNQITQGLLVFDDENQLQPMLASDWEQVDDVTYVFQIRDDVTFSDGSAMTMDDVLFSLERTASEETASFLGWMFDGVSSMEQTGDWELTITLSQPDASFKYYVATCAFHVISKAHAESAGDQLGTPEGGLMGTGPYQFVSWQNGTEVVLTRNENYWGDDPAYFDNLVFKIIGESTTQVTALQTGEVDCSVAPPYDMLEVLESDPNLTLQANNGFGVQYIAFNNAKAPFDDVNVRKAFNLAIDRNYIVEMVTQAGEIPAGAWVPESVVDAEGTDGPDFREVGGDFWSTAEEDYEANCEQARELLAQAGYPNGEGFPETTYLYNTDDKHQAVAEALQQMWSNVLGVDVTLNNQDWNVFLETRSAGDYSICRNGWIADYNDPVSFLDMFMTDNGNNDAHYSNPEYDAMMTTVLSDSDAAGRMELMHQAETLLCDTDCAIAPLYYYSQPYMVSDRVHGMYYTPLGNFIFTYATVE